MEAFTCLIRNVSSYLPLYVIFAGQCEVMDIGKPGESDKTLIWKSAFTLKSQGNTLELSLSCLSRQCLAFAGIPPVMVK